MKLIIKKEIYENWVSFKSFIEVPKLFYKLIKKYYEMKGYEVEIYDNEI